MMIEHKGIVTVATSFMIFIQCSFVMGSSASKYGIRAGSEREYFRPKVISWMVTSNIRFRYAQTIVSSLFENPANVSKEATFNLYLPQNAFVTSFIIDKEGRSYQASSKEREAATKQYQGAKKKGKTVASAHMVSLESNQILLKIYFQAKEKLKFNFTYEELLQRQNGYYEHTIDVDPGQIVGNLSIKVHIKDSRILSSLNDIQLTPKDSSIDYAISEVPEVSIGPAGKEANISFKLTREKQCELVADREIGLRGQFRVRYDVERPSSPREIQISNGYFMQDFDEEAFSQLPKHLILVVDVSSVLPAPMFEEMKKATSQILKELKEVDSFTFIKFSNFVVEWDPERKRDLDSGKTSYPCPSETSRKTARRYPASPRLVTKTREYVGNMTTEGETSDIHKALLRALEMTQEHSEPSSTNCTTAKSVILVLTGAEPFLGSNQTLQRVIDSISDANKAKVPIFSVAFWTSTTYRFLRQLSLKSRGFARNIYEDADSTLQVEHLYKTISSHLEQNVNFTLADEKENWGNEMSTKVESRIGGTDIFGGSRMRVMSTDAFQASMFGHPAIKGIHKAQAVIPPSSVFKDFSSQLLSRAMAPVRRRPSLGFAFPFGGFFPPRYGLRSGTYGRRNMNSVSASAKAVSRQLGFLERYFVFSTIRSLLGGNMSRKGKALNLSLEHSYLTPLSSLVLVISDKENLAGVSLVHTAKRSKSKENPVGNNLRMYNQRMMRLDKEKILDKCIEGTTGKATSYGSNGNKEEMEERRSRLRQENRKRSRNFTKKP